MPRKFVLQYKGRGSLEGELWFKNLHGNPTPGGRTTPHLNEAMRFDNTHDLLNAIQQLSREDTHRLPTSRSLPIHAIIVEIEEPDTPPPATIIRTL